MPLAVTVTSAALRLPLAPSRLSAFAFRPDSVASADRSVGLRAAPALRLCASASLR